jgi:hypothetical protein
VAASSRSCDYSFIGKRPENLRRALETRALKRKKTDHRQGSAVATAKLEMIRHRQNAEKKSA